MEFLFLNLVASAYGEGAFSDCAYNEGCVAGSSTTTGGTALSDTGFWVILIISLACLLVFVALLARWIASRNSQKQAPATVSQRVSRGE